MNERIDNLMYHAGLTAQGCWDKMDDYDRQAIMKFAELILQDIDKIIDELYRAMPLEQAAILLTLDENIKKHFYGIEE